MNQKSRLLTVMENNCINNFTKQYKAMNLKKIKIRYKRSIINFTIKYIHKYKKNNKMGKPRFNIYNILFEKQIFIWKCLSYTELKITRTNFSTYIILKFYSCLSVVLQFFFLRG